MNSNQNGNLRRRTQSSSDVHNAARSAAPRPITPQANAKRPDDANNGRDIPGAIKHRTYQNSYAAKRKRNALIILILVIFLAFTLSLLLVWGLAVMIKSINAPDTSAVTTEFSDNGIFDEDPIDTTPPDTTEEEEVDKPLPVYAIPTVNTVDMDSELLSSNAILIDLTSHTIIAQKGGNNKIFPASMTKVMTLLVAVENMESLEQLATVTKETVDYCYQEGASVAYFKANEVVTMEDLLYGTILPSGADATMTLAQCIAGSEEEFVKLMNKKVEELGLTGTHFVNTSGLHDPNHYSTPHDIALILKAAMENDICYKVLSAETYTTSVTPQNPEGIKLTSIVHNRLAYTEVNGLEIVGGKTGFTPEAGQCLATYAASNDGKREYILVTANANPSKKLDPVKDAEYVYKTFASTDNQSGDVAA